MKAGITFLVLLLAVHVGFSQGFVNLNFENATIVNDPSGEFPDSSYASNAIRGWTAYIDNVSQTDVSYNNQPLSNAGVCLFGTNGYYQPIQGRYFVILQGAYNADPYVPGNTNSAAIGQTGIVPLTAQSLVFWANIIVGGPYLNNMAFTFDGQNLPFNQIGAGSNFTIYGANISAFSGQSGQLLFTVPYNGIVNLDNIQFSASPVPEPGVLGLFAFGGALIAFRRWKK